MTKISNTNLYYWKTDSWGGYTRYCFIDAKGWGGEGKKPDDRKTYASHSTNVFTNQLIKYHLFTTAGSKSSHASSYATAVNRTQTIKVQLKDGSNWVDATLVPADLKASTYALTSATAAGAKSASLAKESTTVSATVDAAYSATVSLTCENVLDGYVFDGWYDANGNKITSYTVSDAHTVFARFIQSAEETNEVTVTYMCGTTSVATAIAEIVGVETEKSFTAPTVTGYKFTEWTIGTGITLKAGTASDATISVVTKSASSDYTLIANYEEVIETIYFINTGKWSVVNLHRWGGTAAETAWPGEAMTSTGEKIGEYDVYSFTAQQGAFKNVIFTNKNTGSDQTGDLEWTAGKYYINNYNGNSGWYTKAEAEELLVVPAVYETVYFVNNKNWTKVQIHAWKGSVNNGWPGQALTATGEKVEGFDVYSFEAAQGTYTNLIFNNKVGDAGDQSSNFVWTADKYYYMGAAENYAGGTKEEVAALVAPDPLATDVFLAGEMNSWNATANEFKKATAEATTASVTISLTAKTYMFKIIAGDWLGNKGTMKRDNCTGWTFEKLDGGDETNCKIVADIAGDYTFTWDLTSKKLTVTYPELPTYNVTATVNPAETGSVEGAKEYKQGEQATLTAIAAKGYEFVNWTVAGEEVSTEAAYSFTVTADIALVANFKKSVVTHDFYAEGVTVSEGGWSINLSGSWNEQSFTVMLWQDNTQGFGTYAANAETGYSAQLGVKELTPTAPGYYTDMQDGTFTFQGTMTDGTDIYEVFLKGALASSAGTGELEAKNEVYFTYEDGEWMIEAFADDETWGLMLAVSAETDPETGENLVYGQYVTDIEAGISEEVAGTCLLYFDDFSGCYVFKGGLATASGNIYPTLYASSLTLMTNELQTGASWVGEFAGVDYYEVLMMAADYSWELDLHARNCTGANGTYTIDVVDEAEGAYSTFMGSTIVTGELTIEDGMYEANVTTVDSEGNPAMSISVLAWEAEAAEYNVVIENATVTKNNAGYNIDLTGEWEGHDIKVEVCDELTADTILANFFIDGGIANDGDQAEGTVEATVKEGVVTITGTFECLGSGAVYNVTISGTLPVEKIAYELNGGAFPEVKVPTNEELALAFKQEYAEYFDIEGLTDTDMKREVGNFIYVTNSKGGDAVKFITENANWKWLHDYILTVAGNIPEGTNVGFYWRANLDGFFHCKNAVAVGGVASADYTEAGKPEAWGAAYQAAHAVVLPTEPVDAPYTLPTPVKEGYTFVGWYDNAEGTGEAYTVIHADWSGTLYAIWEAEGPATALDNIAIEGKVVKTIINGQLIIIKNGVQYNVQGAVIK